VSTDPLHVEPSIGSSVAKDLVGETTPYGWASWVRIFKGPTAAPVPVDDSNPLPVAGTMAISGTPAVTVSGTVPVSAASALPVSLSAPVELAAASQVELSGEVLQTLTDLAVVLRALAANLGLPDTSGRIRVNAETGAVTISSGTVTTVTTLTTASNLAAVGGYNAQDQIPAAMNAQYINLRSQIVVA